MTEWDEQTLVQRALTDQDAFKTLYEQYFPRVYAYVAYRVGQTTHIEDVVSNTFLKVVSALKRFDYRGEGSFAAWLFRIAYHEIVQFYRRERQHQTALALDDLPDLPAHALAPDDHLQRQERFLRLRTWIAELSPRRQEIITLRFFAELRNHEIAEVLGLDERTVASHLSRALDDLQRKAQQAGETNRHEF